VSPVFGLRPIFFRRFQYIGHRGQQKQAHLRMDLCTRQESTGPYAKRRTPLLSHRTNTHQGFFCALYSAILAHIIPVTATRRQSGGATLCRAGADTWGPLVSPLCPGWQHLWMS
jgi:hypothetical protein